MGRQRAFIGRGILSFSSAPKAHTTREPTDSGPTVVISTSRNMRRLNRPEARCMLLKCPRRAPSSAQVGTNGNGVIIVSLLGQLVSSWCPQALGIDQSQNHRIRLSRINTELRKGWACPLSDRSDRLAMIVSLAPTTDVSSPVSVVFQRDMPGIDRFVNLGNLPQLSSVTKVDAHL